MCFLLLSFFARSQAHFFCCRSTASFARNSAVVDCSCASGCSHFLAPPPLLLRDCCWFGTSGGDLAALPLTQHPLQRLSCVVACMHACSLTYAHSFPFVSLRALLRPVSSSPPLRTSSLRFPRIPSALLFSSSSSPPSCLTSSPLSRPATMMARHRRLARRSI